MDGHRCGERLCEGPRAVLISTEQFTPACRRLAGSASVQGSCLFSPASKPGQFALANNLLYLSIIKTGYISIIIGGTSPNI